MDISLITLHTPTVENCGGASALPYHLIKYRPDYVNVKIYSFNINGIPDSDLSAIETELKCKILILKIPAWYNILLKSPLLNLRILLKYPLLRYFSIPYKTIDKIAKTSDRIWIYGEEIAHIANEFPTKRVVITTPDCEAMYYSRVLSLPSKLNRLSDVLKYSVMYDKYLRLARNFSISANVIYHLVGKQDREFLQAIRPGIIAKFIAHPHYDYLPKDDFKFGKKIKLLMIGRYDFYMKEAVDVAVTLLISQAKRLAQYYQITILGKGWNIINEKLQSAGYDCVLIEFADDYKAELHKHNVLLIPITTGTGTKGKVLDAFSNGLMVIGTEMALENINVRNNIDCVQYNNSIELRDVLTDIVANKQKYEDIAKSGQQRVLTMHNRECISAELFALFK
jgi:glycosyltransferase involved in cell wall biosynthesis